MTSQSQIYIFQSFFNNPTCYKYTIVFDIVWRFVALFIYSIIFDISPLRMPMDKWWPYPILILADDLTYYWYHRTCHRIRILWGSHIIHHSSKYFNYSTSIRQSWFPITTLPFWAPLALIGYPPWIIFGMQSISLIYQFWIHTELIEKLPQSLEFVFNTPSHHRVHHGCNAKYLDRNYGGILIIWDRLVGTFQSESEKVVYGLTKNIETSCPRRLRARARLVYMSERAIQLCRFVAASKTMCWISR